MDAMLGNHHQQQQPQRRRPGAADGGGGGGGFGFGRTLLMPGFADSGANAAFQYPPSQSPSRGTAEDETAAVDTFSEAGTELHDNRSRNRHHHHHRHHPHQQSSSSSSLNVPEGDGASVARLLERMGAAETTTTAAAVTAETASTEAASASAAAAAATPETSGAGDAKDTTASHGKGDLAPPQRRQRQRTAVRTVSTSPTPSGRSGNSNSSASSGTGVVSSPTPNGEVEVSLATGDADVEVETEDKTPTTKTTKTVQRSSQSRLHPQRPSPPASAAGFFPSTKPHTANANAANGNGNGNGNGGNGDVAPATNGPLGSPPSSPPNVARRQLPLVRAPSATLSVAPETGAAFDFDHTSLQGHANLLRHQQQHHQNAWTRHRQLEEEKEAERPPETATTAYEAASETPAVVGRLDEASLMQQQLLLTDMNPVKEVRNEDGNDQADDGNASEISSTGSEMGTVINLGNAAARMAEVDEMAALAERDGDDDDQGDDQEEEEEDKDRDDGGRLDGRWDQNGDGNDDGREGVDDEDHQAILPPPDLSSSSSARHFLLNDSGLALPTLASSKSADHQPRFLPARSRNNGSFTLDEQSGSFDLGLGRYNNIDGRNDQDVSMETMAATAPTNPKGRTAGPDQNNPTKSEMLSAALRRMGPTMTESAQNGGRNRNTSLSAPPTPKTPHPAPPRVEDLLRSTLAPKDNNHGRVPGSSANPFTATAETTTKSRQPPPPSFALRSPGSSARYSLRSSRQLEQQQAALSPRFASSLGASNYASRRQTHYPVQHSSARQSASAPAMSPRMAITQTFQLAQKCFSFDNTIDEYNVDDYVDDDDDVAEEGPPYGTPSRSRRLMTPSGTAPRLAPRVAPLDPSISWGGHPSRYHTSRVRHSQSWDVGSVASSTRAVNGVVVAAAGAGPVVAGSNRTPAPFRESTTSWQQHPSFHRAPWHPPSTGPAAQGGAANAAAYDGTGREPTMRGRISSDFSPTKHSNVNASMELQTPQRIEIEREDALDILACLVERGIADWTTAAEAAGMAGSGVAAGDQDDSRPDGVPTTVNGLDDDDNIRTLPTDKEEKKEDGAVPAEFADTSSDTPDGYGCIVSSDSMITSTTEEFRKLSMASGLDKASIDATGQGNVVVKKRKDMEHARRMVVLDELLKSHAYAVEMKRAAVSASAWLKSIGRGQHATIQRDDEIENPTFGIGNANADSTTYSHRGQPTGEEEDTSRGTGVTSDKMELLTLKAMFHRAQLELKETKQTNSILNDELSKCRAEIGRLRSVSRSEHVNRSILDDSHDTDASSVTALSEAISKDAPVSPIARSMSDVEEEARLFNVSNLNQTNPAENSIFHGMPEEDIKERIEETGDLDILLLKGALEKANETICQLHSKLHENEQEKDEEAEPAPIVDIPEIEMRGSQPQTEASSSSSPDHRTVNVRMLDGENFITEWDELRPPLPPPPDHGLHTPIVSAVLEQWTSDRSLHESLISWMEEVMKGADLQSLPPLTISSLDHQVRDGFTMHVLPLLLRRADIHVGVQTRAHRQTTYDMAVTVTQTPHLMFGLTGMPKNLESSSQHQAPEYKLGPQSLLDRQDSMSGGGGDDEWMRNFEPRLSSADSVAHSAVTEAIANLPPHPTLAAPQTPRRSPQPSPRTEYSSFGFQQRTRTASSDTADEGLPHQQTNQQHSNQQTPSQSSIMGALGGALSGLLSRSKYAASPGRPSSSAYSRANAPPGSAERDSSLTMSAALRAQLDLTSSPVPGLAGQYHHRGAGNGLPNLQSQDYLGAAGAAVSLEEHHQQQHHQQQQPYHRVVSAPPGRIGITFVEFRGHAMVSDVSVESPLSGWVFPSDVLIAVDEIPVSGMRVRDIVKVLSGRRDRQRAMRVISSHAMNDFAMMDPVALTEEDEEEE